jgi:hypothetical protein
MKMETTNAHPIIGIFPTPLPPEGTDPVTLASFHKRRACIDEHADPLGMFRNRVRSCALGMDDTVEEQ